MLSTLKFFLVLPSIIVLSTSFSLFADQEPIDLLRVNIDSIINNPPTQPDIGDLHVVYLLNKQDLDIAPDYSSIATSHSISFVTSPQGVQIAGTAVFSYRNGYDTVIINKARSISPSGTVFEVKPTSVFYDLIPESLAGLGLYTDEREVHINYVGLEVGSIVEIQVTIVRNKSELPGFADTYILSMPTTTGLALVSVRHDVDTKLYAKTHLFNQEPYRRKKDGKVIRTWIQEMVPPIASELASKPLNDLAVRIDFSSYDSWADFGNVVLDSLWSEDISKPLSQLELDYYDSKCEGLTKDVSKVMSLYFAIQDDIRYLGIEIGANNWKPYPSSEVLKRRFGDCKDKTNLLVKLLRHGGIEAHAAIVSTTEVSMNADSLFPCFAMLNHAVTYIPDLIGREYWLDPTLEGAPFDWTPPYLYNVLAVILDEETPRAEVIPIDSDLKNRIMRWRVVKLNEDGSARVWKKVKYSGAHEVFAMKPMLKYASTSERDQLIRSYVLAEVTSARNFTYKIEGLNAHDSGIVLETSYIEDGYAQIAGNLMILHSQSEPFSSNFDFSSGSSVRTNDLVLQGPVWIQDGFVIVPPENYLINFNPPSVKLENKFFEFEMSSDSSDQGRVTMQFKFRLKTDHIKVEDYEEYRAQIEKMDAAYKRRPIFEKKAE